MSLKKNSSNRGAKKGRPASGAGPSQEDMKRLSGLLNSGQLNTAETEAKRLIERHGKIAALYNIMGAALTGQGKFGEAVSNYRQALKFDPSLAGVHNNLGNVLGALGKHEEAIASYQQALKIQPDFVGGYLNLGNAFMILHKLEEAVASFQQALKISPNIAQAHNSLGSTLAAQGKAAEAVVSYRQALRIKPDYVEAHNNLGLALKDLGRLEEALASFQKALEIKPDNAGTLYNLHTLLLDPEDMSPAIRCLETAVNLQPRNSNYRFFLGMLLEYAGDVKGADIHFKEVQQGSNLDRARLDAWNYIKSTGATMPKMIGSYLDAFRLGLKAARDSGLVLEFGVRFGMTIRQIASLVEQQVHGFDSFEGLPEAWHQEQKSSYTTKGVMPQVPGNVLLHKGWFDDTLPEFVKTHKSPVRFMNIDCDLYSATKTILDSFSSQIVPGTVIVFDEYIGNEHWREDEFKAFQEAVSTYGWTYEYLAFSMFTKQVVVRML